MISRNCSEFGLIFSHSALAFSWFSSEGYFSKNVSKQGSPNSSALWLVGGGDGLGVGQVVAVPREDDAVVVLGDGELQEGSNWEAAMAASQFEPSASSPSPNRVKTRNAARSIFAASPAPTAMGMVAPTIGTDP